MSWSAPADVRAQLQRRWDTGALLTAHARGEPFPVVDVPLRGPRASEIGERLEEVQRWASALADGSDHGRRFELVLGSVGGRSIGRNEIPRRAVVGDYPQAWALLGVRGDVRRFDELLVLASTEPAVREWMVEHPVAALELAPQWPRLLAAYRWLTEHRDSGLYLRQITATGVDTKFTERHRPVLARLLGVRGGAATFLGDLGLRARPTLVRLRPAPGTGLPAPVSEIGLRPEELDALPLQVGRVLVVENEVSYLSVPVPDQGVVVWGRGFDVDQAARLGWLRRAGVDYWGDIDTHGLAILDRLRAWVPDARSVLMDAETLLRHRDRWGTEDTPTAARLSRLTPEEQRLYEDLVADRWGTKVRLEQERIDWAWALERLARPASLPPGSRTSPPAP